jgi:excisionase family DNA binding protein
VSHDFQRAPCARLYAIDGGTGRLMTVEDMAKHLGLSTATVYKLVARGELMHLRVSNAIRFERIDLDRFLERMRRSSK